MTYSLSFKTFLAMLLVAGTSIGGGMLVLPLTSGEAGFFPSLLMMALSAAAMTASGLILIEATLWMEEGAHIDTITSRILGPLGKAVAWVLYLYICYASIVAYTSLGGVQISAAMTKMTGLVFSKMGGNALFIALFGAVLICGNRWIGRVNAALFGAMLLAYFLLVGMGVDEINFSYLLNKKWSAFLIAAPTVLTTFSYQTMVPSLTPYLHRNAKALRIAVIGGNAVTFLIYAIWQMIILGIIPLDGAHGLIEAREQAEAPTQFLVHHVIGKWVVQAGQAFTFFAIATSFLGMSLGLIDFLSDGLKLPEKKGTWILLLAIVLLPTFFFATGLEKIFIAAMETTGGIGDSILNGIFPVMIAWIGRYRMGYQGERLFGGGRFALICLGVFFASVLVQELFLLGIF